MSWLFCMLHRTFYMLHIINNGETVVAIFGGLSKGFDYINRSILNEQWISTAFEERLLNGLAAAPRMFYKDSEGIG